MVEKFVLETQLKRKTVKSVQSTVCGLLGFLGLLVKDVAELLPVPVKSKVQLYMVVLNAIKNLLKKTNVQCVAANGQPGRIGLLVLKHVIQLTQEPVSKLVIHLNVSDLLLKLKNVTIHVLFHVYGKIGPNGLHVLMLVNLQIPEPGLAPNHNSEVKHVQVRLSKPNNVEILVLLIANGPRGIYGPHVLKNVVLPESVPDHQVTPHLTVDMHVPKSLLKKKDVIHLVRVLGKIGLSGPNVQHVEPNQLKTVPLFLLPTMEKLAKATLMKPEIVLLVLCLVLGTSGLNGLIAYVANLFSESVLPTQNKMVGSLVPEKPLKLKHVTLVHQKTVNGLHGMTGLSVKSVKISAPVIEPLLKIQKMVENLVLEKPKKPKIVKNVLSIVNGLLGMNGAHVPVAEPKCPAAETKP